MIRHFIDGESLQPQTLVSRELRIPLSQRPEQRHGSAVSLDREGGLDFFRPERGSPGDLIHLLEIP